MNVDEHILIVSFSSRKNGNCHAICDFLEELVGNGANSFQFFDHCITQCGACGYECLLDNKLCPHFEDAEYGLMEQICLSDRVYFIVPIYQGFPSANFFIFNERSQVYFQGHPERIDRYRAVAKYFIAVGDNGLEYAKAAFQAHGNSQPAVLHLSAHRFGKSNIVGNLMDSAEAQAAVSQFVSQRRLELV